MSSALSIDTGDVATSGKPCTRCKKVISSWERFKQCHHCRELRRQQDARRAERRMQRDDGSAMDVDNDMRRKENVDPVRKPAVALKDLQGEEKERALAMMKNRIKSTISVPFPPPRVESTIPRYREYQSATQLYAALKSSILVSPSNLKFRATHSIVASIIIDNALRAELVAKDLRKIAGLSFAHRTPLPRHSSSTNTRQLEFLCTCLGYITAPENKLKSQTGLKDWIQLKSSRPSSAVNEETLIRKECSGTVLITVEDDRSHPLGLLGQRIAVRVKHVEGK
ncbi:uncharacterized protein LACBIDRAFT_309727 [Laccaria bicolor S238N-H82]|uniref:Predicted protein n=1 Tax=Laccaria bicolor (strain S238N-H82 / ATCC MYA-4686) TaxID=486041 RepID=B0DSY0_LACBS|nr:uncharacterized protein LACBIDRAFT_309727 [Laccaria bicolor S238N-H82]EDR02320.1 predicted protein [Laccaria bicolor S238N-H82]|eukprot:XP_001886997.1 predicted protein [Laccaria bicolor S238N-H82]